jgi:hypothetical protein
MIPNLRVLCFLLFKRTLFAFFLPALCAFLFKKAQLRACHTPSGIWLIDPNGSFWQGLN